MSELDWLDDDDERGLESTSMTNADKIRSMDDEDLADWLNSNGDIEIFCDNMCPDFDGHCDYNEHTCRNAWLKWLKQEHKEG